MQYGQTLQIIYNMISFSGHPVCHLGLNWCILLGLFLLFTTKIGNFGNTGLFDQVFHHFACIQMLLLNKLFQCI